MAVSQEVVSDFPAERIINNSGLNLTTGTHSSTWSDRAHWQTGTIANVGEQYVTFDLGGSYLLDEIRIWNLNREDQLFDGIQTMHIKISADNDPNIDNWDDYGEFILEKAPGRSDIDYSETFALAGNNPSPECRYVRFDTITVHGGTQVGLSEVKFYGTTTNQAPVVDAGAPQQIVTASTTLDGSVSDDGQPDPPSIVTIKWRKLSGDPNVSFLDDTALNTEVTLDSLGSIVLQLEADDGMLQTTDAVSIRRLPGDYAELPYVTIDDYSSSVDARFDPQYIVNGAGFDPIAGTHLTLWNSGNWQSAVADIGAQYITFDLGSPADLNGVKIWNINRSDGLANGIATMHIWSSVDGSAWTDLGDYNIPIAPGVSNVDYSIIIPLNPPANPRYVRFDTMTNYGGITVGLSEVRFSGVYLNQAPQVVGEEQDVWLDGGAATVQLNPTVVDDGYPNPPGELTYQWLKIDGPDAYTYDPGDTVENPTVIITVIGTYVFNLEVDDGEFTDSDTVTIRVFADSCEHAKAQPGFVPVQGDANGDCQIDIEDFALVAQDWLLCYSSDLSDCN